MTQATHTPGPWVNHDGIIRDSSPEGWLVATCRFNPKDDANARLIAAAPDLLAAVEGLLDHAAAQFDDRATEAIHAAFAAIAKAKGA